MNAPRWPLFFGALFSALAIGIAALQAHALGALLSDAQSLHRFQTALDMHKFSSLGLLLIGLALHWQPRHWLWRIAAGLVFTGSVLFCGNLYLLSLTQSTPAGWLTPLGGMCLMAGWLVFALGALFIKRN